MHISLFDIIFHHIFRTCCKNRYRPCSPAVLQKKFGRAFSAIKQSMAQGQHGSGTAQAGEELDQAQLMVEHFLNSTMSRSRSAARIRQQNQVVERSLIGQQPALAQASIRPYLRQPLANSARNTGADGDGTTAMDRNPNPFTNDSASDNARRQAPRRPQPNQNAQPGTAAATNQSASSSRSTASRST